LAASFEGGDVADVAAGSAVDALSADSVVPPSLESLNRSSSLAFDNSNSHICPTNPASRGILSAKLTARSPLMLFGTNQEACRRISTLTPLIESVAVALSQGVS
jgi:hypothetical protein